MGEAGQAESLPPVTPAYESGHAGDAAYLSNGIVISGGGEGFGAAAFMQPEMPSMRQIRIVRQVWKGITPRYRRLRE